MDQHAVLLLTGALFVSLLARVKPLKQLCSSILVSALLKAGFTTTRRCVCSRIWTIPSVDKLQHSTGTIRSSYLTGRDCSFYCVREILTLHLSLLNVPGEQGWANMLPEGLRWVLGLDEWAGQVLRENNPPGREVH